MSKLDYIRDHYKVPAKRGGRVKVYNESEGTITGARGSYLRVRLDGDTRIGSYHPTWRIEYLDAAPRTADTQETRG